MAGIAQDVAVNRFSGRRLLPLFPHKCRRLEANIGPSQTLAMGQILGLTVNSTNDVQTINLGGTPTGGYFILNITVNGNAYALPIAYNATSTGSETGLGTAASPYVTVQGALVAALGSGNVTVSGSAQPGNTQTITFAGNLAAQPIGVLTIDVTHLTGGTPSATVVHKTTGVTGGTFVSLSAAQIAAPSAAPTLTPASGTLAASQITVGYTYTNGVGETPLSPLATVAADGTHKITISSIAFPTGVTGINIYASNGGPLYLLTQQTTAAAFDVTTTSLAAGSFQVFPPNDNTTCPAACINEYDIATDASGNVFFGTQAGSEWGQSYLSAPAYEAGDFAVADLVGLDANALKLLRGRIIGGTYTASGAISSGTVHIP